MQGNSGKLIDEFVAQKKYLAGNRDLHYQPKVYSSLNIKWKNHPGNLHREKKKKRLRTNNWGNTGILGVSKERRACGEWARLVRTVRGKLRASSIAQTMADGSPRREWRKETKVVLKSVLIMTAFHELWFQRWARQRPGCASLRSEWATRMRAMVKTTPKPCCYRCFHMVYLI